jgi:hypothetical protein
MNLRCAFCQTPFTLGRTEKLIALQQMDTEKLSHYDAHCPRCRKATPVERQKMEVTFPNWRDALHELEVQVEAMPASESKSEVASTPKTDPMPEAAHAKHHRSRAGSKAKEMVVKVAAKPASKGKKESTSKKKSK